MFKLRQYLAFKCNVCGELYPTQEEASGTAKVVVVFGAVKYAVCCCCMRQVGKEEMKNHWYKKRWDKYAEKGGGPSAAEVGQQT